MDLDIYTCQVGESFFLVVTAEDVDEVRMQHALMRNIEPSYICTLRSTTLSRYLKESPMLLLFGDREYQKDVVSLVESSFCTDLLAGQYVHGYTVCWDSTVKVGGFLHVPIEQHD